MFCEYCGSNPTCVICGRNDLREAVPTARFWVWERNGWAKLSLRPNESRTISEFRHTEEGWASSWTTWTHEGDGVRREYGADGVDCDGRYESYGECWCHLAGLMADYAERGNGYDWVPAGVPAWQAGGRRQRDHYAEAAGY